MNALLRGTLIGAFVGVWAGGAGAFALYRSNEGRYDDLERRVPILVAKHNLEPGTPLTPDALKQVKVRWDFATASLVQPGELSKVTGRHLVEPLRAGEPLQWATLATDSRAAVKDCTTEITPRVKAATGAVAQQVLDGLAPHKVSEAPPPLPELPAKRHVVRVVTAMSPIRDGQTIDITSLTTREVPDWLTTPSAVPAEDITALAGARALGSFEAGDILLWPLLERPDGEATLTHCAMEIERRVVVERKRAAKELAQASHAAGGK